MLKALVKEEGKNCMKSTWSRKRSRRNVPPSPHHHESQETLRIDVVIDGKIVSSLRVEENASFLAYILLCILLLRVQRGENRGSEVGAKPRCESDTRGPTKGRVFVSGADGVNCKDGTTRQIKPRMNGSPCMMAYERIDPRFIKINPHLILILQLTPHMTTPE